MTLSCLTLVTLGPGAMISDLNRLCYHHYIHVLDPILQVMVTVGVKTGRSRVGGPELWTEDQR